MSIVAPIQSHFDGGEISPLLYGRVDAERYKSSLALCKNWIPTLAGALTRRPGTEFIGFVNDGVASRLIPFVYSTTQAYMLEFGQEYIRFWTNYGFVETTPGSGVPYSIQTQFLPQHLKDIRFTQSADVLYLVHPNFQPQKLMRLGPNNWRLVKTNFQDGPYLPVNSSSVTLTPAATTGNNISITIGPSLSPNTVSNNGSGAIRVVITNHGFQNGQPIYITGIAGTTEANGTWTITVVDANNFDLVGSTYAHAYLGGGTIKPNGFVFQNGVRNTLYANTYGYPIRIQIAGKWGWGLTTGAVNTTTGDFNVNIVAPFNGTTASTSWRAGVFGFDNTAKGNWPATTSFHDDRLTFSGSPLFPQRIDASVSADYENFLPIDLDNTVKDSNALNFTLNANDANANTWLNSDERGLLVGSTASEWILRANTASDALTTTNVNAKRSTNYGSAPISSVQSGKATFFVQRGRRKLRELVYGFDIDGYRANDLTELAEHITGQGVTDMAVQSIPNGIIWLARQDGALVAMTYDRNGSQLRVGWHQHALGGVGDRDGSHAFVESIAVIPSPDGLRDDLWMIVRRFINGQSVRTVEVLTKVFEDIDSQPEAWFVDCGLTYNNPIVVFAVSAANPPVAFVPSHGFSTGNLVRFDNTSGLLQTINGVQSSFLNGKSFKITVIDADNFSLQNADSSACTAYSGNYFVPSLGRVRKQITTISGLSHLEGETVQIYADGAVHPPQAVSGGAVTLEIPSAIVTVGYGYNSDAQTLRLEAGSRNGTSLGKTRRIHRAAFMLHRSQGLNVGASFSSTFPIDFRTQGVDLTGHSSDLFTGIQTSEMDFDYDFENQICMRVSSPVPCTLLAIMPMMETQDRG